MDSQPEMGPQRAPLVVDDAPSPGRVITVFGASRVGPETAEYRLAYRLGQLLGGRGYAICNGGHDGTMEAAAKGAREAGGRTIGVLVRSLSHHPPNPWLDDAEETQTLLGRLERLVSLGEAFIVLPGGIGTLLEMALVWNLAHVRELEKPVILVGPGWRATIEALQQHLLVRPVDRDELLYAESADEAVAMLDACLADVR